jgi:hypothetical protein
MLKNQGIVQHRGESKVNAIQQILSLTPSAEALTLCKAMPIVKADRISSVELKA